MPVKSLSSSIVISTYEPVPGSRPPPYGSTNAVFSSSTSVNAQTSKSTRTGLRTFISVVMVLTGFSFSFMNSSTFATSYSSSTYPLLDDFIQM